MMTREEKRKALLSQKLRTMRAYENGQAYEALLYEECARLLAFECRGKSLEEAQDAFEALLEELSPLPQPHLSAIAFAKAMKEKFGALPMPAEFSESAEGPENSGTPERARKKPRICYVKNRFLQRVVDLSGIDADWFYTEDFKSACEETEQGEREGCLLPYLDEEGKPMPGIVRLISEHGLKKCRLFLPEKEDWAPGCLLLASSLSARRSAAVLEIELFPESEEKLLWALLLCTALGAEHSLPRPLLLREDEENRSLSSVLKIYGQEALLKTALFGIELLIPDSSVTGFYDIERLKD